MNIAFAINNSYAQHLEIALFSLLVNNKQHVFDIYIVSADLNSSNKQKLKKICSHYSNANIHFLVISDNSFIDLKILEHFSRDMYSRYLLPNLLMDKDKVLYLDADILITGDIRELYETHIDEYFAAGVRDLGIAKDQFKDYLEILDIDNKRYFNSGVLLLNLANMRKHHKTDELIAKTAELLQHIHHPDQDIINLVFRGKIKEISNVWNYQDEDRKRHPELLRKSSIIHYTTALKPWNTPNILRTYNADAHTLYEEYEYQYWKEFGFAEKVSIIVPVYNTAVEYIDECLDSLLYQTYKNTEIIIVDDGSTNEIASHLDAKSRMDKRISVIHKKNAGTNRARQAGFESSTGEYIAFVDSDDTIEQNFIQKLYKSLLDNNTDMAMCECWDQVDTDRSQAANRVDSEVIKNRDEVALISVIGVPGIRVPSGGVLWAKLYKRELIDGVDWNATDYLITEDEFFMTQVFSLATSVSMVQDQLYYYRRNIITSKEHAYPRENQFNGKMIPILATAADLYEATADIFSKNKIQYDETLLLDRYVWMLNRFIGNLLKNDELDEKNRHELERQSKMYLPRILKSRLSESQKLRVSILYGATLESGVLLNDMIDNNNRANTEFEHLNRRIADLEIKITSFLSIKRSARLLLGNIKRNIKARIGKAKQ